MKRISNQPGHPLKKALAIVTLSVLLSACAGLEQQSLPPLDPAAPDAVTASEALSGALTDRKGTLHPSPPPFEDPLPEVVLTEDLVFKLLSAEIAFQKGDWQAAYVTTLVAARQTRDPRLARRATEIALAAKQSDEALAAIRLWRDCAPHSEEATQYYLGFIMLGDNLGEAKAILEQRLKDARPAARSLLMFQVQRLLGRARNKDAAAAMLESLLTPYLSAPEAHLALAQNASARGDHQRARSEARTALEIKPDSELAALTLAHVTVDKEDAEKFLASFLHAYPQARDVRVAYARLLVDQKHLDRARREFETLHKAQPQDLTTLYALGILGAQTNDVKMAEHYLKNYLEVLAANPDDERDPTQALLILAQIAEERKDTDTALKWLSQIESGQMYLSAQIKRAQLIAKRGDLEAARKLLLETDVDGERDQAQILVAEASLLRDSNHTPEALTVLEDGIKRFPNNTDLLYDYAMAAEKVNNLEVMEATLRKVIELTPKNQHAYNALGYSLAERNIRLEEAFSLIDKAFKLAPEDPFIMDSMGWVQFRLGRLKEAEELLRRAYAIRPDPEIAVHLGEVLWVKGQKADAQQLWRDAKTKDPLNDTLKSTLARLNVSL
jgi:tetratricopeptide (TPR) repeat protein